MTYPFGLYTGEPTETEILQRLAFHLLHGPNHLAIKHTCPACGGTNAEWVRNEWSICYNCEIAFDAFEYYYEPTPEWIEYTEEVQAEDEQVDCTVCPSINKRVAEPAKYAVKEGGVVLLLCEECMKFLYGMHETVLLPGDTYIPCDDEEEIILAIGEDGGE